MTINRDKGSFLLNSPLENQRVISRAWPVCSARTTSCPASRKSPANSTRSILVQVKAHGGLGGIQNGRFRMQNGMPGVLQGGLNVIPCQFRVTAQH